MRLVSWNTAKRLKKVKQQTEFIGKYDPDIIALQEIIPSSEAAFRKLLKQDYPFIVSSFDLAEDISLLVKKRMFGQLIASKYKLTALSPRIFNVPWPERVLSASIKIGAVTFDLHTTHIPPGSSNGSKKIEMIEGIVKFFKNSQENIQILCGDFNTPQREDDNNGLVTFGQRIRSDGSVVLRDKFRGGFGSDWDSTERSLFVQLNHYGLADTFRHLHPNDFNAYSWQFRRKEKTFRTRFDHIFADKRLKFLSCSYLNYQGNLSDHSPILAEYIT
jgi:exonuclease III